MSELEKKLEEELEKLEKAIKREVKIIEKRAHHYNLFPLMAGGLAVFFLMVSMVVAAVKYGSTCKRIHCSGKFSCIKIYNLAAPFESIKLFYYSKRNYNVILLELKY